jgi:hypothetical protein
MFGNGSPQVKHNPVTMINRCTGGPRCFGSTPTTVRALSRVQPEYRRRLELARMLVAGLGADGSESMRIELTGPMRVEITDHETVWDGHVC